MPTILTNFGPGFGPFVRTLDMARELTAQLKILGEESIDILIPGVFGEGQLRIIREQTFNDPCLRQRIFLSDDLGKCLEPLMFSDGDFNQHMLRFLGSYPRQQEKWNSLLTSRLSVTDIEGSPSTIDPETLTIEISRNPVIRSPIEFSYFTAIESQASIFEAILEEPDTIEGVDLGSVEEMLPFATEVERAFRLHFLPTIRTLSWRQDSTPRFPAERVTPPLIPMPVSPTEPLVEGLYISQSGIGGLQSLYEEAFCLPGRIYTNRAHTSVPVDQIVPPRFIAHPAIIWAYARAAWNTIWLANLTSTPLICPTHIERDHPEIFFNIRTVEQLGLAAIWDPAHEPLEEFLERLDREPLLSNQRSIYNSILEEFGTLDGIEYCARQIVEDYVHGC